MRISLKTKCIHLWSFSQCFNKYRKHLMNETIWQNRILWEYEVALNLLDWMYNVLQYCVWRVISLWSTYSCISANYYCFINVFCVFCIMSTDQAKLSKANQSKNQEWNLYNSGSFFETHVFGIWLIFGWIIKTHFRITVSNSSLWLLLGRTQ